MWGMKDLESSTCEDGTRGVGRRMGGMQLQSLAVCLRATSL